MNAVPIPATGKAAPYGLACTTCSKAKTRCVSRSEGVCERCHRLGKDCVVAGSARKRKDKTSARSSRRSKLEDKLDDLVTLLQSQNAQIPGPSSVTSNADEGEAAHERQHPWVPMVIPNRSKDASTVSIVGQPGYQNSIESSQSLSNQNALTPASIPDSRSVSVSGSSGGDLISPEEAEEILSTFRTEHLRLFPFIYIPPDMSAVQFQIKYPILWLVVRGICNRTMEGQSSFGLQAREIISRQVLVDGERNLDILYSIIAFVGWGVLFIRKKPALGAMCHLGVSVACDLRLDRKSLEDPFVNSNLDCFRPYGYPWLPKNVHQTRSNEDRRAVIGCFICSIQVMLFIKCGISVWKPSLEVHLQKLWDEPDAPQDRILVAMVRILYVAREAYLFSHSYDDAQSTPPSAVLHIKGLEASLAKVENDLPPDILHSGESQGAVQSHLRCTRVLIYELAISSTPLPITTIGEPTTCYRRIEYMNLCVQASRDFLDYFLQPDHVELRSGATSLLVQLGHCLQVLYRLSLLDDPSWDRQLVKETADVVSYLERGATKLQDAHYSKRRGKGLADEESLVHKAAMCLRMSSQVWAANLAQMGANAAPQQPQVDTFDFDMYNPMDQIMMEFLDTSWLAQMMGS
ncbi:hypothetical protein BX600DRAFT_550399 [Xylariales sp. PMI_506]|nr:hypothetical protein BX600DRAFT_550399 [Xylariales sp. PMI_506]